MLRDIRGEIQPVVSDISGMLTNDAFFKIMTSIVGDEVNMWQEVSSIQAEDIFGPQTTSTPLPQSIQQQSQQTKPNSINSDNNPRESKPLANPRPTPKKIETKNISRVSKDGAGAVTKKSRPTTLALSSNVGSSAKNILSHVKNITSQVPSSTLEETFTLRVSPFEGDLEGLDLLSHNFAQ
jgi:hypothetical protein